MAAKFPILLGVVACATLLLVSHDVAHAEQQAGPAEPQRPEGYGSGYMQPGYRGAYTGSGGNGQYGNGGAYNGGGGTGQFGNGGGSGYDHP